MKAFVIPLLALAAALPATETALTLTGAGPATVTIDPGLGTISLWLVQDGALNKRPSSANFLTDIRFYLKRIAREDELGNPISTLQAGSENNVPSPDQMILKLAEADVKPKKRGKDEGEAPLPLVERARNTEADFWGKIWTKDEPYDGILSAALGPRFLIIVVPAVRSFLLYEIQGENIIRQGWRNYGPDLYVPTVMNSLPTPQEIFKQLPPEIKEEHQAALDAQLENLGQAAGKVIPMQDSAVWVSAGPQDRFVLCDFPNKRVVSYQWTGKNIELRSVRNMEFDLMIPGAFKSQPDARQIFAEFLRDKQRQAFVDSLGIDALDVPILKALVGGRQVKTGKNISPIQATATGNQNFDIVIDFTQQQKIVTYRAIGQNNGLELRSMRDYTVDSALSQLDNMRVEREYARDFLAAAKQMNGKNNHDRAWTTAKIALNMDPSLHQQLEKMPDMVRDLKTQKDWAAVITAATEAAKKERERIEAFKKRAQDARDKKKEGEKPKK